MELINPKVPKARYNMFGETLRYVIPSHVQCSIACGGRACKYEDPSHWSDREQAIKGLYSSWVTDSLLAMSRPSTEIIKKYDVIDQFQRCGLKTVINLQSSGEHASCGSPLEQESGFTYLPETFMEAGIYFYNFEWKDYGVAALTTILDMVKVMCFAIQEGKIAVHCHAGLGRTGVLLACYLVFTEWLSANQAILLVRAKRPNSIQTRGQLHCVRQFAEFLVTLRTVFPCASPRATPLTLSQYLTRQQHMLHGYEARQLKHMPKLVQLACRLLLDVAENRQVVEENVLEIPDAVPREEDSEDSDYAPPRPVVQRLQGPLVEAKWSTDMPLFYTRRSLSYSDSDLRRLQVDLNLSGSPLGTLSSTPLVSSPDTRRLSRSGLPEGLGRLSRRQLSFCDSDSSVWEQTKLRGQWESSPNPQSRKRFLRDTQRSQSLGSPRRSSRISDSTVLAAWLAGHRRTSACSKPEAALPVITIKRELTLDSRRLLVAQALAVDLSEYGQEEHRQQVALWQGELNSKQGAWERFCTERDPFVLSGLMWSWLEQLKEPVVTKEDVHDLERNPPDSQSVFDSLGKGPRQTLICVLDCFAHLLALPADVESAFQDRTIKAFTKMRSDSDDGGPVYKIMREILPSVLHEMRSKAMKEQEPLCDCP